SRRDSSMSLLVSLDSYYIELFIFFFFFFFQAEDGIRDWSVTGVQTVCSSDLTSAHQYQGETPICSERSYTPKIVPRLSLPAITSARDTPGIGRSTTVVTADSHFPTTPVTSSLWRRMRSSMIELFPIVPIRTTSPPRSPLGSWTTAGSSAVTLWTSSARSPTARITPGQSSAPTTNGAAAPFCTSGNVSALCVPVTYFGPPSAWA